MSPDAFVPTDFTVAEELHRRTANSSIESEDRRRVGSAVSIQATITSNQLTSFLTLIGTTIIDAHTPIIVTVATCKLARSALHETETSTGTRLGTKRPSPEVSCTSI